MLGGDGLDGCGLSEGDVFVGALAEELAAEVSASLGGPGVFDLVECGGDLLFEFIEFVVGEGGFENDFGEDFEGIFEVVGEDFGLIGCSKATTKRSLRSSWRWTTKIT